MLCELSRGNIQIRLRPAAKGESPGPRTSEPPPPSSNKAASRTMWVIHSGTNAGFF